MQRPRGRRGAAPSEPVRSAPATRLRRALLLAHRYVGLVMTVFLVVAGSTGALLTFQGELDAALNPELMRVAPSKPGDAPLEAFELEARVHAQLPHAAREVIFDAKPGDASSRWAEMDNGEYRQAFIDPYSGKVLGTRVWGKLSDGAIKNLMPFIYRLHYSLALDDAGTLLFGVVALLWTFDCFVGALLTFPTAQRRGAGRSGGWLRRWLPAWKLRTTKLFAFVFTWHRASGLWTWAMLFVFAWSAVGLNLPQLYRPIMKAVAGLDQPLHDQLAELAKPYPEPGYSLREAHAVGRRLMEAEAAQRGFEIERELRLSHHADHGAFSYTVESSLDISKRYPRTEVYFDHSSGRLLGFEAPTGIRAGNTISSWLYALHFAAIGGVWYRIFVSFMGAAVVALSVTGAWIWLRKRTKRRASPATITPN